MLDVHTVSSRENISSHGENYNYRELYSNLSEGEKRAKIQQESIDWQRRYYTFTTNSLTIQPGELISIPNAPGLSNERTFHVIKIIHTGHRLANNKYNITYYNVLTVIPTHIPYRSPITLHPPWAGFETVTVESPNQMPYLDSAGRYHVRFEKDDINPNARASCPIRLAQFSINAYGGSHFPLYPGTIGVCTHINSHPDQPILLGTMHDTHSPDVVTHQNAYENILRTWSGNSLLMRQNKKENLLALFTHKQKNIFQLRKFDKKNEITLKSKQGDLFLRGKSLRFHCADSMIQSIDKHYYAKIKQNYQATTKQGDITLTSGKNLHAVALKDLAIKSHKNNLTMRANGITLTARNDTKFISTKSGLIFSAKHGDLKFIIDGKIILRAPKIIFKQPTCCVIIHANGNITIDAAVINLRGKETFCPIA